MRFVLFLLLFSLSFYAQSTWATDSSGEDSPALLKAIKDFDFIQKDVRLSQEQSCSEPSVKHQVVLPAPPKDCDRPFEPVNADDSPQKAYFQDLLKKGLNAPLSDFLKLWYPDRKPSGSGDPFFFHCESAPWADLQPGADGSLPQDCAPDTLYSYGPPAKLETLKSRMPDREEWLGSPNPVGYSAAIFTTMSAASTFYYGTIPVRIKLKAGTPIRVGQGNIDGAVSYRTSDDYQDFKISDSSVIESWSYGTPEHYDEIVRDILKISSGEPAIRYVRGAPAGSGVERLYQNAPVKYVAPNENGLKADLLEMIRTILAGKGRIYFSKGACRNREVHFSSPKHDYMNP
jgi:hypothetical protein